MFRGLRKLIQRRQQEKVLGVPEGQKVGCRRQRTSVTPSGWAVGCCDQHAGDCPQVATGGYSLPHHDLWLQKKHSGRLRSWLQPPLPLRGAA